MPYARAFHFPSHFHHKLCCSILGFNQRQQEIKLGTVVITHCTAHSNCRFIQQRDRSVTTNHIFTIDYHSIFTEHRKQEQTSRSVVMDLGILFGYAFAISNVNVVGICIFCTTQRCWQGRDDTGKVMCRSRERKFALQFEEPRLSCCHHTNMF